VLSELWQPQYRPKAEQPHLALLVVFVDVGSVTGSNDYGRESDMIERTRNGQFVKPRCPNGCGKLRVKPAPRTKPIQLWQCVKCKGEWTNATISVLIGGDE
jgi:ribosomal protein L37AE/L43A